MTSPCSLIRGTQKGCISDAGDMHPGYAQGAVLEAIGVREGILLGGRIKFALKITICPKNKKLAMKPSFLVQSELGLKLVNLFYIAEFIYNRFVCNVNSLITLHFVRSRWHLLHAFQFVYNFNSAITFLI